MGNKGSKPFDGFYTITEDVNYFKYKCTIRNFSRRPEKTGEYFLSPTFEIGSKDRSEWCLLIYPNGGKEDTKEYVSVFLYLMSGKTKARIKFSILNDKEEEKNVRFDTKFNDFLKNRSWGYPDFINKDFLIDKSNGLLINDELTILCEVEITDFEYEMLVEKTGRGHTRGRSFAGFYSIQTDVNYFKYEYSIENFSRRPEKTGEAIISPTCVDGFGNKSKWCLYIFPNSDRKETKEYVSVFLCLMSGKAKAKFKISILNDKKEEKNVLYAPISIDYDEKENNSYGFLKFVKRDFLLDESNGLLIKDKLTILFEVEVIDPKSEKFLEEVCMNHENSKPFGKSSVITLSLRLILRYLPFKDGFYNIHTDVNYFKCKYTIQNFSLRSGKTGEHFLSPTFGIETKNRSEWCLIIYPNGYSEDSKDYVAVFLMSVKAKKAKAKFRFYILNKKGEEKNIFYCRANEYFKGVCWGVRKFIKKRFLLDESNGLLINDKLTILCEAEIIDSENFVEKIGMDNDNNKPSDVFCSMQIDDNYFKYKCLIQNFSQRSEKTGEKIISPTCVIGSKDRSEWCLYIYPNGDFKDSKEYVSVFLILLRPGEAKAKFKFSILNDKEEEKNIFYGGVYYYNKDNGWGESKFIKKEFLLNESNGLLINDQLTILCEVEIMNHDNPETSINVTIPRSKLSLDYANLFDSTLLYDCVIKVEDAEIQVHKAVLAARSPVFYDIFNSTSDQSQTNIIEIKDFRVDVVREMLNDGLIIVPQILYIFVSGSNTIFTFCIVSQVRRSIFHCVKPRKRTTTTKILKFKY
uniref:BTB domain-containing protein n=1 Tax=Strongyloides papillosus TaxID=174720 RepID=A0A0N5CG76_STREA